MSMPIRKAVAAVAFGAFVLAAPLALATSVGAQTSDQPATGAPMAKPDDSQLQSFAAATLEVERLNQEWADRIAAAENPEEQQALRNQALEQMASAVREEGLSVSEYNAIVEVVQADPEVAETVDQYRGDMQ
jgi:hypothetical protein